MFFGSIPALVTPFSGGRVAEDTFREFVEWQIDQGSNALVPCGTTGEAATLSTDEHRSAVEIAVEVARGRVPVIAGCGSNSTAHAIELTKIARDCGADAALHVPPYYNRPNQDGIYLHLSAVADLDIPVILYNVPARTITDIAIDTMAKLSRLPNVVGVKDATANLARTSQQRLAMGAEFNLLSGEDATALGFMAHGGHGCISVVSNIAPRLCADFQNACLAGDYKTALVLQDRLMPLHDAMFCEANPGPVKYAASRLGLCEAGMRLPLVPISQASQRIVDAALARVGLVQARAAE